MNADLWEYLGNVSLNKGTAAATEGAEATITDEASVRRAAEAYDEVLQIKGEETSPEILRNVIAAHLALGEYDQALAFADRAQASRPDDPALWSMRADVYGKMDRPADAADAMDEVLALDPDYPNGHARRGFFKLSAGDTDAAIEDLRLAVQEGTDPEAVAGQMLSRGYNDYFKAGQYGEAIQMFTVGAEFAQPGRTQDQLYFFKAYGYYQQGVQIDASDWDRSRIDPHWLVNVQVIDAEDNLFGIVTTTDVERAVERESNLAEITVAEIATASPVTPMAGSIWRPTSRPTPVMCYLVSATGPTAMWSSPAFW